MSNHLFSSILSNNNNNNNENVSNNIPSAFTTSNFDPKELEIMKFKMIAFVKTYENEFRKMKLQMNELK